jgi:tetratricopeptide (TPR) repeat protein
MRDSIGVCHWNIDIHLLGNFSKKLGRNFYNLIQAEHKKDFLIAHYYEKALSIFERWRSEIDSNKNSFDDEKRNEIFESISGIYSRLCDCYTRLDDYEKAVDYCDKAIFYAKQLERKELEIKLLQHTMILKSNNLCYQSKCKEARTVSEECHNSVVEAYDVLHPLVLEAANCLIRVLIKLEGPYNAERFARICYQYLTHGQSTVAAIK